MSVTEEEGGRLNTFAKEPEIQIITKKSNGTNSSLVITIIGIVLIGGCIAITFGIS